MIRIIPIETPTLGDRSYLATDGEVALVVDPQRDIDRVLALAGSLGVRITHVLETHVHNDYVTGGYALARQVGAEYLVNADDEVSFARRGVRDGDVIEVGRMRVAVLHTPGHTFTHLSYVVEADGAVVAVFTGGSLLYGSTGRPDLLGARHSETLARHQHASAHRLAEELPAHTQVFPTHGFGSFCSATQATGDSSTIGQERRQNPALTQDEETYVAELLAALGAYPAYYAHMAPRNAAGPDAADLTPPAQADPAELRRRIDAGEWVVDLRTRTAFAAGHLPGTLNFGLDGGFVTYLGWLVPWGTPVTLLGEAAEQVAEAQRELVRIGIDRPAAAATGLPEELMTASFRTATFTDLAWQTAVHGIPFVLDVRRADERAGAWIEGSVNVPLHSLRDRAGEIPADREVWVHCAAGYRASIAAAILDAVGRTVVAIDDDFASAADVGLDLRRAA
jgi:hydroxyacylglutathione hydrolase